jgi:hypothetical protein
MGLDLLLSIGISVGAWAGVLVWLAGDFTKLPFPFVPAWAPIVYWAAYFVFGGGAPKFTTIWKVLPCHLLGSVVASCIVWAWLTLGPAGNGGLGLWIFVMVVVFGILAHISTFSSIPATILGACVTIGVFVLSIGASPAVTPWVNLANMIVIIVVGLVFAWLSEVTAVWLAKKPEKQLEKA